MKIFIKDERGNINPSSIFATAVTIILTVYVVYAMISAFVQNDPSFGKYGWPILGALIVGVIAFFRSGGLFK